MPSIECYPPDQWAEYSARRVQQQVTATLAEKGHCSVMLTGGNSAAKMYSEWANLLDYSNPARVDFFFGDERCVPPDSPDSNYGLAMKTLFRAGIPPGSRVERIRGERLDRDSAARMYAMTLPVYLDVLLVGVGEDGHIASLFPDSESLKCETVRVLPVDSPKPPRSRLTVSPSVFSNARAVFVLAPGRKKREILERLLTQMVAPDEIPAALVIDGVWLTDTMIA